MREKPSARDLAPGVFNNRFLCYSCQCGSYSNESPDLEVRTWALSSLCDLWKLSLAGLSFPSCTERVLEPGPSSGSFSAFLPGEVRSPPPAGMQCSRQPDSPLFQFISSPSQVSITGSDNNCGFSLLVYFFNSRMFDLAQAPLPVFSLSHL